VRTLALLALLVVLASPARAAYPWNDHPDPDVCSLREITYSIDGARRQGYRFGGKGDGFIANEFKRQDLDDPTLKWHPVSQTGSPPARRRAQSFYDARRDRFLFIGGIDSDSLRHDDVWEWDHASGTWSDISPATGGPDSVTLNFPMTYDSRRDRLIYVNNDAASQHPVLWFLDLSVDPPSWSRLEIPASFSISLVGLTRASAAYDSLGDRLFLKLPYPDNGLYVVDLSNPTGYSSVPTRSYFSLEPRVAVDPVHNRLLLDVDDFDQTPEFALVEYDLATLDSTEVPVDDLSPDRRPMRDQWLAWATDPVTGAIEIPMIDYPGREARATVVPDATIHWSRRDDPERPAASSGMAGAVDPAGRSLYLFGGVVTIKTYDHDTIWRWDDRVTDDLYRVDLDDPAHHELLEATGVGPGPLQDAVAVFDSAGHRLVFYGGWNDATGGDHNELWALELEPTLHWTQIATTNPGPMRRRSGMTIDPATRRIYVVGGQNPNPLIQPGYLWSLDLGEEPATWSLVRSKGPHNLSVSAGFDRVQSRLLGVGPDSTFTIALSDTTSPITGYFFNHLDPINSDDYRYYISGAMDVRRNVLFVHGGKRPFTGHNDFGPAWGTGIWDGETFWDRIEAPSVVPPPGRSAFMAFDPVLDRMVLVNGYHVNGYCKSCEPSDTDYPLFGAWTLQLDDQVPTLVDLAGVALEPRGVRIRFSGAGAEGPVRVERAIDTTFEWTWIGDAREISPGMYEWIDEGVVPGTAYRYRARYTSDGADRITAMSEAVLVPGSVEFALRAPGGAVGGGWPVVLEGRVPPGESARVELVNIAGRVVSRRAVTGAFRTSLAPIRSSAGIYFARLVQGEHTATIKLVRF